MIIFIYIYIYIIYFIDFHRQIQARCSLLEYAAHRWVSVHRVHGQGLFDLVDLAAHGSHYHRNGGPRGHPGDGGWLGDGWEMVGKWLGDG